MNRTTVMATLVAATIAATGFAGSAGAAEDTRPCVTQPEWRQAQVGMKKARVHAIFDTPGRFADGAAGGYSREYRPCAWGGGTDIRLFIEYNGANNRVVSKRLR